MEQATESSVDTTDPWYDVPVSLLPTHDKKFVQWTINTSEAFKEWYTTTKWYTEIRAKNGSLPSWNPARKSSLVWARFTELATVKDGKPMIRCNRCHEIYDHLTINNNGGTMSMQRHLQTKACLKEQNKERVGHAYQPSLKETLAAQKVSSIKTKHYRSILVTINRLIPFRQKQSRHHHISKKPSMMKFSKCSWF